MDKHTLSNTSSSAINWRTVNFNDLRALHDAHGAGFSPAQLRKKAMAPKDIREAPKVFQPRDPEERHWEKSAHVETLSKALKNFDNATLEPITLFPVAGHAVVIDGHMRLAAYREVDPYGTTLVPVTFFSGTIWDALLHSAESNSADKLPLTTREKTEKAWQLCVYGEEKATENAEHSWIFSKVETARACGCSTSIVGKMRAKLVQFPAGSENDPREMSWWEAQRTGTPEVEYDEDWKDKEIRKVADTARRYFGSRYGSQPEILLDGICFAYREVAQLVEDRIESAREAEELFPARDKEEDPADAF